MGNAKFKTCTNLTVSDAVAGELSLMYLKGSFIPISSDYNFLNCRRRVSFHQFHRITFDQQLQTAE
ncbi:hypothetical protein T4B_10004 [Trichinella pseudospiralis]|uniref:Uncharacterized protein n=2 Tax=Trichinella pseudospiralis TaxID=6337 RepID=A0A0V1JY54_TRIPS|nr:hypothetical protein T4A_5475 [Trichinella pseudospiralis]KRY87144.1 hypothetical protein T4D_13274 [Trichinella pseudospiralis]KRZ27279.1 hypothetical protein T4B_10004 [Trichinella pseudospiralis]KRZ39913.1 hypothetical protein T4C_1039 [Trichinella pseudospiralis]